MRPLILIVTLLVLTSCRKDYGGNAKENLAPETYMVVDTIIRSGTDRFRSVIEVHWWGNDPDGFVKGYEISFDLGSWTFTTAQDSVFTLELPSNSDTFDFPFYIRAVDNNGLADPSPANLKYPVKNSPPAVSFIISSRTPLRSFPALKYFWEGTDPDGNNSLDKYQLVWNDTTLIPMELNASVTEASFLAVSLSTGVTDSYVYPGSSNNPSPAKLPGMKLDADNILYIRALDKVGEPSPWIGTPIVYIRKPTSDILFVNAQQSSFNRTGIQNFYAQKIFTAVNKSFDTLQAGPGGNAQTDLSVDPATQDRVFSFFSKLFVYSEDAEFLLSFFQKSSTRFFSNGGKIMMITQAHDVLPDQNSYLDFTPAASFTPRPPNLALLFNSNDSLYSLKPGYPSILNGSNIITGIRPIEVHNNNSNFTYESLYRGVLTQDSSGNIGTWKGNSSLVVKRNRVSDGEADFILSMVPVHQFQNNSNMDLWFKKLLVDELKF